MISIKLSADPNGYLLTGKETIATIVINTTNMTGAVNFTQASGSSAKNFAVVKKTDEGTETITSEVAFPTATVNPYVAPKTEETDTLTAKTEITIDGQKWTGIALYEASFNLNDIDAAKGYGIRVGETGKVTSIVAGTGTVDFVLAYYGDAAANVGKVQSFWTAK